MMTWAHRPHGVRTRGKKESGVREEELFARHIQLLRETLTCSGHQVKVVAVAIVFLW